MSTSQIQVNTRQRRDQGNANIIHEAKVIGEVEKPFSSHKLESDILERLQRKG